MPADYTVNSKRDAQVSINTGKTGGGSELRALGDSEGRQIVSTKMPVTPVQRTTSGQVKASAGTLYGFNIAFVGATIGDKVDIYDSLSGAGTIVFTIICATANETHSFVYEKGMIFSTGIYHEETKTTGTIYATYLYE